MKIALLLNSFEGPLYQALPFVMEPFSFFKANSNFTGHDWFAVLNMWEKITFQDCQKNW